mmetsp:Transcript_20743/g.57411  ORF Transcript_20743/g.57411 Transcript_20743/m.57411 type:complete len:257 (-) Transcript_20743:951-1721(-)
MLPAGARGAEPRLATEEAEVLEAPPLRVQAPLQSVAVREVCLDHARVDGTTEVYMPIDATPPLLVAGQVSSVQYDFVAALHFDSPCAGEVCLPSRPCNLDEQLLAGRGTGARPAQLRALTLAQLVMQPVPPQLQAHNHGPRAKTCGLLGGLQALPVAHQDATLLGAAHDAPELLRRARRLAGHTGLRCRVLAGVRPPGLLQGPPRLGGVHDEGLRVEPPLALRRYTMLEEEIRKTKEGVPEDSLMDEVARIVTAVQ